MKYRKKPVTVEAVRWTGDNLAAIHALTGATNFVYVHPEDRGDDPDKDAEVYDVLHSTWVMLAVGDWIIKGVKGEFYPCDPEVFEATYEAVGE